MLSIINLSQIYYFKSLLAMGYNLFISTAFGKCKNPKGWSIWQ